MKHNPYCARLAIEPPRVEDVADRDGVRLFHLLVVALLERGEPMELSEILERLERASVTAPSGDLEASLRKSWHGQKAVYRDAAGRYGLNLSSTDLRRLIRRLELEPRRAVPAPLPEPEPELPGDDMPLSPAELQLALGGGARCRISPLRRAAAVLDAHARPLSVDDLNAFLDGLVAERVDITAQSVRFWASPLLRIAADGTLSLDRSTHEVGAMRRAVRELERAALVKKAREDASRRIVEQSLAVDRERRREQAREVAAVTRAVVRALPEPDQPAALAVLDVGQRSIRTYLGAEIDRAAEELARFDLLAGLSIRRTLDVLGLTPDRFWLVDLDPPRKTRRINQAGRTLTLTPELLIAGTTGISRPLADPAKVAGYLASGDRAKLVRRLESDVKALYAFYHYGALQGHVRLRWGFLDEGLAVDYLAALVDPGACVTAVARPVTWLPSGARATPCSWRRAES